jgi:ribosomal protein L37E
MRIERFIDYLNRPQGGEKTYEIVTKNDSTGIKCLTCGLTSWNHNDVQYKYCGNCHKFHNDINID